MRKTYLVLGIMTVLAGCGGSGGSSTATTPLGQNEALWQSRAVSSYTFKLNTSSFSANANQPVQVEVRNGQVTSIVPLTNTGRSDTSYFNSYSTVEKLFAVVQDAEQSKAASIQAQYDPTYGFPTQVFIDYSQQIADEEFGFTVTDFQPLP